MSQPKKNINWLKSDAKIILEYDVAEGFISMDEVSCTASFLWNSFYRHQFEFRNVPFLQFEKRLSTLRASHRFHQDEAKQKEPAMLQFRRNHPRKRVNKRGEVNYDISPAKNFLIEDVKNKVHETLKLFDFRNTREEYLPFKLIKFKEHVYQEIEKQKFIFYLELKRKKENQVLRSAARPSPVVSRLYY